MTHSVLLWKKTNSERYGSKWLGGLTAGMFLLI